VASIRGIRQVLAHVRNEVDQQYAGRKDLKTLRLQGVTALIFLRLISASILEPYKYFITHGTYRFACVGHSTHLLSYCIILIMKGTPNPLVSRSLKQIGKIIQALANMRAPTAKVI
jgi:hypothetical protein